MAFTVENQLFSDGDGAWIRIVWAEISSTEPSDLFGNGGRIAQNLLFRLCSSRRRWLASCLDELVNKGSKGACQRCLL